MSDKKIILGQKIRYLLEQNNLNQPDLAKYLGFSKQNVNAMLKKEAIQSDILVRVCQFLHTNPNEILDWRDPYSLHNTVSMASDYKVHYQTNIDAMQQLIESQKDTIALLKEQLAQCRDSTK